MRGRVVGKSCRCVIVPCAGRTLATAALVEKNDTVSVRIEKASKRLVRTCSWPAMHEHDRFAICRAVLFPVNLVSWMFLDNQMARFAAEWVRISGFTHFLCHSSRM